MNNFSIVSWEDKHFLYHIRKQTQQKNINTLCDFLWQSFICSTAF